MPSFTLTRHIDPPSPPPKIDLLLIVGAHHHITKPLAANFARAIKYTHIDVVSRIPDLEPSQLGLAHPIALKQMRNLPPRALLIPLVREMLDAEVRKGTRKVVMSGVPGDPEVVVRFRDLIADPSAIIFVYESGDFFDGCRGAIWDAFGERSVLVKEERAWEELLAEVYRKGMAVGKPKCEVERQDRNVVVRADSPLSMLSAANGALRRR